MAWELSFLHMLESIHDGGIVDGIMILLSTLGNAGILWIAISLILLIPNRARKVGLQTIIAMLVTFIVGNLILKNIIHRARPYVVDPTLQLLIAKPSEYSFPSGHTMNGYTAAITFFFYNKKWGSIAIVFATAIAFSRMYNLVHFPTDIMGGLTIGICSAISVHYFMNRKKKEVRE